MKKLLSVLAALALVLSLCTGAVYAADSGEIVIDWQPASLGDDPNAPEYDNVYLDPAAAYAAEHPEEYAAAIAELEQWAAGEGLDPDEFDAEAYLAEILPMTASEEDSVTTPSTRRENDPDDASHYCSPAAEQVAVGDQKSESICWAVAALDCLYIGAAQQNRTPGALSADHLVYYAYHGFTDSLNNPERDYITPEIERGNVYASLMTLASWAGPAAALDKTRDCDIYADNALWLENGFWLSFAGSEDRAAVKNAVKTYGAVAASLIAAGHLTGSSPYYNSDTCAYCYTKTDLAANQTDHEVVIVGWDDDYSASNFQTAPTNADGEALNGAWLCRNTWGDGWGDGGWFWLSYYDTGLCQNGVGLVLDASDWGEGKTIYQYDCSYSFFARETIDAPSVTIANVYTAGAADCELITAAGTYATAAGTAYTVQVYTGLTDAADPTSGTLAASGSGTFAYAGYQTHFFDAAPSVEKGEKFAVVYTLTFPAASGNKLPVCTSTTATTSGISFTIHNSANAGESFLLSAGEWTDRSDSSAVNYRIKAVTEPHTHSWSGETVTEATCSEAGQKKLSCSCGAVDYEPIAASGHTLEYVPARAATAVLAGNIEYWKCSVCGAFFADSEAVTKLDELDTVIAASFFTDVPANKIYHAQVLWAVENGITSGMNNTEFLPYDYCTRAQILTFLWRCAGCPEPTGTACPFTDVYTTGYYYKAVLWAVEEGIVKGVTQTELWPHAYCTRAQMVTFLWRAAGSPAPAHANNPFTDLLDDYYYPAVLWAAEQGIAKGVTQTEFAPYDLCQRWQAVMFLYRAYAE